MNKRLVKQVKERFERMFRIKPLLVASPGRINLIGEHTDYNSGFVFPATINKYIISALSKSKGEKAHIYSLDFDEEMEIDLNNLQKQESGSWKNYVLGVIYELKKRDKMPGSFNFVFGGDIPIGVGLSSSAALENSVVFGLNKLFEFGLSKEDMVKISMTAEHEFAGVKCGIMDQFSNMHGKAGHALLLDCADLSFELVPIQIRDYQLVLINTNVKHELADSAYNKRKEECIQGLTILQNYYPQIGSLRDAEISQLNDIKGEMPQTIYNRCLFVIEENTRVKVTKTVIKKNQWEVFGQLLFASHQGLQYLYEVSCKELDFIVEYAKKHDAVLGSRMMGGGFGGCTLNLIKKECVEDFTNKIAEDYFQKFCQTIDTYPVNISNGTRTIMEV